MDIALLANSVTRGLFIGGAYSLVAIGFVLIYKSSGILNFAQGYMVMLGAYFCYAFAYQLGLPVPVVILLSLGAGFALGLVIERGLV